MSELLTITPEAARTITRLLEIGERWKETGVISEGELEAEWEAGIVKLIELEIIGMQAPEPAVQPPEPPVPASMGGLVHFPAPEPHH